MYTDYSPAVNFPSHRNRKGHQVVVLEGGEKAKDVVALARREELTTRDADGNETFWIVSASDPKKVWELTGNALRRTLWFTRKR